LPMTHFNAERRFNNPETVIQLGRRNTVRGQPGYDGLRLRRNLRTVADTVDLQARLRDRRAR
jgi:hypothetical protein